MEKFRNKTLLDRVVDKTKILSLALALHLVPSMAKGDTATINTPDTISNFKEDSQKYNNTALLKDWLEQNTNLRLMVVDKLPNKIINGKIVPYSIEEQTNNIGIIYIPKNLTSADSRIIQEELRKGSFMNNKELQELDRLKTMEHRIFNYKLGLYINKYIDKLLLSSKNKNPDNKKYLQLLSQQCKDSSGLNNKEIDKIKLNQNDSERIEKYLEQEGVYCNNNIDTSELLRLINEYGLQSIFLDQKFTDIYKNKSKEEYRKIRELRKKLLKLKSSIENIKKLEKTHPENKVKKIVRLIRSNIQYDDENLRKENQGNVKYIPASPKSFQKNLLTQCVGYTQLGKYLEDIPNVYYLPINITRHILSLALINDELYFTDITENKFQKLSNSDFTNGDKDISLLKKYAKGQEIKSQTISFSQKFFDSIYKGKITNPNIFLQDKREAISSAMLNNLAVLYKKQSEREIDENKNQDLENKAERYYLLAIEKGDVDAIYNLAALYSEQYQIEVDKNKKIELENKAEKSYLLAIEKGYIDAIYNLAVLYEIQSKTEIDINKKIELENKAEKYYLLAIEKKGSIAMNAMYSLADLYYIKSRREENKLKKEKLEKITFWLWNKYYKNKPLTKKEYQELIIMINKTNEINAIK